MFIPNYFWKDSDTESNTDNISVISDSEDNFANILIKKKVIKRSTSFNSFFTDEKITKQDKLDNLINFNNLFYKIDKLDKKICDYSTKINEFNDNNYKLVIGFGGSLLLSIIAIKLFSK